MADEYWSVLYRATADFGPVIRAAAEAKAALDAMSKSAGAANAEQLSGEQKLTAARQAEIQTLKSEAAQVQATADSYKRYNQQALFGGRSDMQSHLSDMDKELQYETLLNRQRWLTFSSPQQAYSWRQQEYQQRLLMNYAGWNGYTSADQNLSYLQKETAAYSAQNAQLLQRADLYRQNADAATAYLNALNATHKTAGTVGEGGSVAGVQALNNALIGLPDQVTTQVSVDTSQAMAELGAYKAELASVPRVVGTTDVNTVVNRGSAAMLRGGSASETELFNDAQAKADLAAWVAELQHVPPVVEVTADFNDAAAMAKAQAFYAFLEKHRNVGMTETLTTLTASGSGMAGGGGGSPGSTIVEPAGNEPNPNNLAASAAAVRNLSLALADEKLKSDAAAASEVNLVKSMAAVEDPAAAAKAALEAAGSAAEDSGNSARRAYGYWGLLTKQVSLFGGMLGSTEMIGQVAAWHVLLDGAVEVLALWVPALATAAVALGAWGAAGYKSGKQVYDQLLNAYTVSQALGVQVAPLTGGFQKMADAVRPQVYELFGDALDVMNSKGGTFNNLIQQTGQYLDRFAAKLVTAMQQGGGGFQSFLQTGQKDLALIGQGLQSVGTIAANFIKATALTHIAEDLATVGDAVLALVADISKIPTPVLAALLGLHGLVLWGGLFTTALTKVGLGITMVLGRFGALNSAATAIATGLNASTEQLTKLAKAAPAVKAVSDATGTAASDLAAFQVNAAKTGTTVEELATQTSKGKELFETYATGLDDAGQKAIALGIATGAAAGDLEKIAADAGDAGEKTGLLQKAAGLLTAVPMAGWVGLGAAALGIFVYWVSKAQDGTQKWLSSLQQSIQQGSVLNVITNTAQAYGTVTAQLAKANEALDQVAKTAPNVGQAIGGVAGHFEQNYNPALDAAATKSTELSLGQQQLGSQLDTLAGHAGDLSKTFGTSLTQSMELVQLSGGKVSDMLTTSNKDWATTMQMVDGLITGYQAMGQQLGTIGGDLDVLSIGESTQVKNMDDMNTAWDSWTKTVAGAPSALITVAQGFNQFTTDAKAAGASMTGLNAPSLQLQSDFQSSYSNVEQLFDAMRNSEALTGSGGFNQFVKDAVASLIPMAGGSKEAAAQISALAQEAGGPATTNIQTLQKWVGNIKDPLLQMQSASNKAAEATANLSQDASKLANTIQSDLNTQMAQSIESVSGAQAAMSAYGLAVMKYGADSTQAQKAHQTLVDSLYTETHSWSQANATANTYTGALTGNAGASAKTANAQKSITQELQNAHVPTLRFANDMEAVVLAVQNYGANSPQAHLAMGLLTQDLTDAGVNSGTAKSQVDQFASKVKDSGDKAKTAGDAVKDNYNKPLTDTPDLIQKASRSVGDKTWPQPAAGFWTDHLVNPLKSAWGWVTQHAADMGSEFTSQLGKPVEDFFTKDIPNWYHDSNKLLAQGWGIVWNGFANEVDAPLERFFTSTIPGWCWDVTGWASSSWKSVWNDFNSDVLSPLTHFFTSTVPGWWKDFTTWGSSTWKTIWSDFNSAVLSPLSHFFTSTVPGWWNDFTSWASKTWKTIWGDFNSDVISPVSHFFTSTVPGWFDSFGSKAASTWKTMWTDFNSDVVTPMEKWFTSTLPSAIEGAFKNSVNWVISNVINKVIGDINAVTKVVGIPAIPSVPGIAAGGLPASRVQGSVPGPSDSDNMLARVMGGEYVVRQPARMALEATYGRGFMDRLNHFDTLSGAGSRGILASQQGHASGGAMVRGYAGGGGILGDVEGFLSGAGNAIASGASGLVGLVKGGASALASLASQGAQAVFNGVWDGSIGTLLNLVPNGTVPGSLAHYAGAEIKNGIDSLLGKKDAAAQAQVKATSTPGAPSGTVAQWIAAAIKATGVPASWANDLNLIITYESGGNPNAINLSDSNAAAGDPSRGLMQTIMTTFEEYHQPGTSSNIYDPVANIAAGINYIKARYGTIANVPGVEAIDHGMPYVGYAAGGDVIAAIRSATSNENIRAAMAQGSYLESKWNTSDHVGKAYGPYLITLPPNPSKDAVGAAESASVSAKTALPYYTKAVNQVGANAFKAGMQSAATQAASIAQHATQMTGSQTGFRGGVGSDDAWGAVTSALGITNTATSSLSTSGTSGAGPSADSSAWATDAAAVVKDWAAFLPAWNTLNTEKQPKGVSDADWRNWRAYTYVGSESEKYLAPFVAMFANPSSITDATVSSMTASEGNPLMTAILKGVTGGDSTQPLKKYWPSGTSPSPAVGTKYFSGAMSAALSKFNTYGTGLGAAKSALDVMGVDVSTGTAGSGPTYVPGIIGAPPATTGTPINLQGYATMGAPASGVVGSGGTLGFAGGGTLTLNDVAGMFSGGFASGGRVAPLAFTSTGQAMTLDQVSKALAKSSSGPSRVMSTAAAQSRIGAQINGGITINNPQSEVPSTSITKAVNRLSFLAGRGV